MTARTLGLPRSRPSESAPIELVVAVAASVLGGCMVARTGWVAFAPLGVAFFAALGALRPALFLVALLLARPLLDDVSDVTVGARSANLGGALALALILAAALATARRRAPTWPSAAGMLMIVVAISAVSAAQALLELGSPVGMQAATEIVRLGALLAVYVLAANVFGTPAGVRRVVLIAGLSGVVPAILGLLEWIKGPAIVEGIDVARISGPFVGPVPFGIFLAVSALILLFLPRADLHPAIRPPALLVVCTALVGTSSRTGWAVFVAGVLLLGWQRRRAVVVTVTIAAVALVALVPAVHERALPAAQPAAGVAAPEALGSFHWRVQNWQTLLRVWREQPIFGHGLRSTNYVNPAAPFVNRGRVGGGYDAHNLVVKLLVEGGVLLLAAYVAFFVVLMRSVRPLARDAWELQPFGRIVWVLWVLLLIVGLTSDDPLSETALMLAVLAMTGALDAAHRSGLAGAPPVSLAPTASLSEQEAHA